MSFIERMICAKCRTEYEPTSAPENDGCGGRIDIYLNIEALKENLSKQELIARGNSPWKYFELLPIFEKVNFITLGEGNTPLLKSDRFARTLGLKHLYWKVETQNPSGSFKDRPISVGVSKAVENGSKTVVSASSGNAAAAMATYGAKAGLEVVVFVPEHAPADKITQLLFLGAQVFRIARDAEPGDPAFTLLTKAYQAYGWTPIPSMGPFNCWQFEGNKTIGYEVAEQMGWKVPDWMLFPTGSGGHLAGTMKGFKEFNDMGFIEGLPRAVAVQPTGCAPVVQAIQERRDPFEIVAWGPPQTIAGGLADLFPWDGDAAVTMIRESQGTAVAVTDEEILRVQRELARLEGVFGEPSGVAGIAGLKSLIEAGVIDPTDTVVVTITGIGFKDTRILEQQTGKAPVIAPSLEALEKVLQKS
ncbi:MAG: threonine synthase [Candidatus Heimdallarchaeota archaeon]